MAQEIVVNFDNEGNPIIEAKGIKGKSCKEVTAFLEKALGQKVSDTNSREFYEKEVLTNYVKR